MDGVLCYTRGQEIRGPGRYRIAWSGDSDTGRQLGSGVYFVQLNVGTTRIGRKLLFLK
jgi:hypothetical protein